MKAISLVLLTLACAGTQERTPEERLSSALEQRQRFVEQCYFESDTYMTRQEMVLEHQFTIRADGTTADHRIVSQGLKDPNFSSCFLSMMKPLNLGAAETPREYKRTLTFSPVHQ
jgi:hypothetical protein